MCVDDYDILGPIFEWSDVLAVFTHSTILEVFLCLIADRQFPNINH
jgi:hypothetical protein